MVQRIGRNGTKLYAKPIYKVMLRYCYQTDFIVYSYHKIERPYAITAQGLFFVVCGIDR